MRTRAGALFCGSFRGCVPVTGNVNRAIELHSPVLTLPFSKRLSITSSIAAPRNLAVHRARNSTLLWLNTAQIKCGTYSYIDYTRSAILDIREKNDLITY